MSRNTRSTAAYSGGPGGSDTPVWDCSQDGHRSHGDHRSSADPRSIRYLEGRQPDQQSRSPTRGSVSRKFPFPRGLAIRVIKPKPAWYKQSEWGEQSVRANRRACIHGSRACVVCRDGLHVPDRGQRAAGERQIHGRTRCGDGPRVSHVGLLVFYTLLQYQVSGSGDPSRQAVSVSRI
jgi:hypothetical protein